jgi:hypothetical protein
METIHGRLTGRVIAVCDDALSRMQPGSGRDRVERIRAKLTEPLRIAMAGSVSSGKSTMVNALLGQQIAAVDVGECTRIVTWFRYDHYERIDVWLRSGQRRTVGLEAGGQLPESFGVDPSEVARAVVWLSNENLRNVSIIDTPGLYTVNQSNEAATSSFLGVGSDSGEAADSRLAMSQADALIFLMPHLRAVDAEVLTRFRALYRGTGLSAVNAVGVLSKIDKLASPDEDPWKTARRIAKRAAIDLRSVVCDVIPVIGLLAETSNTDRFTEDDARALGHLAELDPLDREDALMSADDFLSHPSIDLAPGVRDRLLGMLDLYGLGICLEAIDDGAVGAAAILERLDAVSGFAPLRSLVDDVFTRRSDLLKAHAGICDLQRLSFFRGDPGNGRHLRALQNPLEQLELDRDLHDLRIVDVARRVYNGDFALPGDLLADVEGLLMASTPASRMGLSATASVSDIARAAVDRATRWGAFANDNRRSPAESRMARSVKESYEHIWDQITAAGLE